MHCMPEMGTWQTPSGQSSKKRVCTRWISRSNQLLWLSIPCMGISVVRFPTWILHICRKKILYRINEQYIRRNNWKSKTCEPVCLVLIWGLEWGFLCHAFLIFGICFVSQYKTWFQLYSQLPNKRLLFY